MTMDKAGVKRMNKNEHGYLFVVGHLFLWIPIDFGELVRSGVHTLASGKIKPTGLLLKA